MPEKWPVCSPADEILNIWSVTMDHIYTLGIDIGSTASKCIMLADGKEIVAKSLISVGAGTSGPQRAISEVLEQAGVRYEKTDSSTVVSEIPVYGNKSVFSISVSEQTDGTQLLVTMVRPHKYLSADGIQRAVTAVADRISQYLENETVLANASLRRSKLQESVCKA